MPIGWLSVRPWHQWQECQQLPLRRAWFQLSSPLADPHLLWKDNDIPTAQHVKERTWHYAPCPMLDTPMPSGAFIHYLLHCKVSARGNTFTERLPKKLSESMLRTSLESPLKFGWGIYIIEGWNRLRIRMCLLVSLLVGSVLVVVYAHGSR